MGHYAGEMQCNECGRLLCRCPTPDHSEKWIVDADLTILKVRDFDKKHEYVKAKNGMVVPGMPTMLRAGRKLFDTKEEAEVEREDIKQQLIEDIEDEIAGLQLKLVLLKSS